jgi:hypothetical protein
MNRYPQAGGTLTYAIRTFGHDHGYLVCACIYRVLYQFLNYGGRSLDNFARRNEVGDILWKYLKPAHYRSW